ncbi:8024_t:CDS:1, partial [Paraglomus brasilianum]
MGKQPLHSKDPEVHALVYFIDQCEPLEIDIPLPAQWLSRCRLMVFERTQQHLVVFNKTLTKLVSVKIIISGDHDQYAGERDTEKQKIRNIRNDTLHSSQVKADQLRACKDFQHAWKREYDLKEE